MTHWMLYERLFVSYKYDPAVHTHTVQSTLVHTPYPAVARARTLFGTGVDLGDGSGEEL